MINEVLKIYYDPSQGLTNAKDIYNKLNKKYTLKSIKEVLENVKNKQIKSNNEEKLFIPITTPSHSFSADLTFYNQYKKVNSGYHILLTIINNNSKKAYVYPLKNKNKNSMIDAFTKFLNDVNKIEQLQTDKGKEFQCLKELCNNNNIKLTLFDTGENKNPMSIIERFNRTIRSKIDNYLSAYNTTKYIDVLDKLLENYNNTIHSTIKDAPNNITEKKEKEISNNKMIDYMEAKQEIKDTFEIGDSVRLLKKRKVFGKGEKESYSKTLYEIIEMNGNKIIIRSENNKVKEVMPYQIKKIENDIYENPYLNNKNDSLSKQKKIIENEKNINKQNRAIKKTGLDIDLNKQKLLQNALKKLK